MSIFLYTGLPGSGKTTELANIAYNKLQDFDRNFDKRQKLGLKEPRLFSNIRFSDKVEKEYGKYINYFEDIYQMPTWTDSEIFIDEAAVYFDSRMWATLPDSIRRFLFTHRHLGTNLYMIAQDFTTIDNSFRRLTEKLFYVQKRLSSREPSPLRPKLKHPFNFCLVREVNKAHWQLEKEHYEFIHTSMRLFRKKHFEIFDTRQKLPEQTLPDIIKRHRRIRYVGGEKDGEINETYS